MKIFNKKFRKILLLWYPTGKNFGDYYIYKTVSNYLISWGYQVINMDVGLPYSHIAKFARKCDLLWFAGGGIIERDIPNIIKNFREFHQRSHGIKYGITGLSIGEFDYSESSDQLNYWVNNALFFYSRDDYTASELNKIASSNKIISSVDVVFAYDFNLNATSNPPSLGVNLRYLPYTDLSGDFEWEKWDNAIVKSTSLRVIGIPDQHDVSTKVAFSMDSFYSPEEALKAISKSNYVIAMRFHVVLVAARLGIPCIPICYCPKVERLAEQLGISALKLSIHDYNRLPLILKNMESNENEYKVIINSHVKILEQQAKKMFETIKIILMEEI